MVKFITIRGTSALRATPYYIGIPQHERIMSRREAYELAAERTGYKATAIRAVFMALREFARENQRRGNITYIDEVASIRNYCKGAFASLTGPWAKGTNYLLVAAVPMEPFKTLLAATALANNTTGAKPVINTVLDETTREYDAITGCNVFSIAGADLGVDATKADEYVVLVDAKGAEHACEVVYSDLANVKAKLAVAAPAGEYTLKVYTRSGLGDAFGVKVASRKVTVG